MDQNSFYMAVEQNKNDNFLPGVSFPHWQSLGVGVFFDVTLGTERGEMGGMGEGARMRSVHW